MRGPPPRWPGSVQGGGVHSQYLGKCTPGQPLPGLPAVWGCIWASHPEASSPPRVRPRADRDRPGVASAAKPLHSMGLPLGKPGRVRRQWEPGQMGVGRRALATPSLQVREKMSITQSEGARLQTVGGPLTPEAASAPPPKDSDPICVQAGCPVPSPHVSRVPRPWL